MKVERWIACAEYEPEILAKLGVAMRSLGYELTDSWDGIGGSQDIAHWEVSGPRGDLTIETETYSGVTVEGPAALVAEVRERFQLARGTGDTP
jgi:hypothetical protein